VLNLIQDFRSGLRVIKRSKGLAFGVVISMGLGLGVTASVFSFVDFFVFRPLPVPQTDRVVRLANSSAAALAGNFSYPEYQDYLERNHSFSGIATHQSVIVGLSPKPADQPRVTLATLVSGNFFSMLQVKFEAGRGFLPEEDSIPGRDAVAVISHSEWLRDFGGAADVVGRAITINGLGFTIVGVAPKDFGGVAFFLDPAIYIPRMMIRQGFSGLEASSLTNRSMRPAGLLARLKPGVRIEQAREDVGRIAGQLEAEHPETNKGMKANAFTQYAFRVADRPGMLRLAILLLAVAFLVLGIACVNVSNLLLSTVPARTREMSMRFALGAPRWRLLRQLLIESIILSGAGTLVGFAIASWCARFLSIRFGSDLPLGLQVQVDERVVFFTLGAGVAASFISGAVPAWRCCQGDLNALLKSSDPRNRQYKIWGRQILVGVQVTVAALLLVSSGLLVKDLQVAAMRTPGFRVDNLLTLSFDTSIPGYDRDKSRAFYNELAERVRGMPGVQSTTIASVKPFGTVSNATNLIVDGYEMPSNQQYLEVRSSLVGNGYFETLQIPIIRGRAFDRRDGSKAPRSVIIDETMAQRYWPNRDPIGARVDIKEDGNGGPAEVIGIARNSKYNSMAEEPLPFMYRSYDQSYDPAMVLFVETAGRAETLTAAIRTEVRNIAPDVPIFDIRTMRNQFEEVGLFEQRLIAQVFTTVASVGLLLGVLGLYGVIAYSVGQRTYEIGIRMAVGASDRQILRMVLMQGLRSSGPAAVVGIGLGVVLRRLLSGVMSFANSSDTAIYIGALLLMLLVIGAACYLPARRASTVDPNVTLRS
jgi:putative ABC transport system permease protein